MSTHVSGKVSSPSTFGLLLHEYTCFVGQCKCWLLCHLQRRRLRFLLTVSLGLLISLHMTHPATLFLLCLKGQWRWEKPTTGRQAGKEWGSSTPFCPWGWLKGRPIPNVTFLQTLPFEKLKVIWRVIYYSPKLNTGNVLKWWLQRTSVEKTEFHLLGFSNTSC